MSNYLEQGTFGKVKTTVLVGDTIFPEEGNFLRDPDCHKERYDLRFTFLSPSERANVEIKSCGQRCQLTDCPVYEEMGGKLNQTGEKNE